MNRLRLFSAVIIALSVPAVVSSTASSRAQTPQTNEVHQTYDLGPGGVVSVTNVSGYIRVTSWDENRVRVDAIKRSGRGDDLNQIQIQINSTPGALVIRTAPAMIDGQTRSYKGSMHVDYDLKVPRSAILNSLTTVNGDIWVTGPVAQLAARVTHGSIEASNVAGTTSVVTTHGMITARNIGSDTAQSTASSITGNVTVDQIAGRIVARSLRGSVTVTGATGDVNADSTNGTVTVENARGRVVAVTQHGVLVVRRAAQGVSARSMAGSIEVTGAQGRVTATSVNGGIALRGIESTDVQAKTTSGGVTYDGSVNRDGRYSFESFAGEIVVAVPGDSQFSLVARTYHGSINTEFPLLIDPGNVTADRQIRGVVGKGGAEIIVVGFNGRIQIKKSTAAEKR
jgi:DUF4097 and DUF4098 domain-containing protein YvlB